MAVRRRGRPKSLTLDQIRARNAELNKEVMPGQGNSLKELRYALKLKQENSYV